VAHDRAMHVSYAEALIVTALLASLLLALGRAERLFSLVALAVSAIEALIVFDVITFKVRPFRLDIVFPAALVIAGGICWSRLSTKGQVTAATVVTLVGLIQLLTALHVFR
jgi:Na+/proline symporter